MNLESCLGASRATPAFAADVRAYADFRESTRIVTRRAAPRIKVLRVVAQLLSAQSDLAIDSVTIDAASGCADYRGTVTATTPDGPRTFRFVWDCSWRAEQEGWRDARGGLDQARAAREFGFRCFAAWIELAAGSDGEDGGQLVAAKPGP